jgi:hypothetical protein
MQVIIGFSPELRTRKMRGHDKKSVKQFDLMETLQEVGSRAEKRKVKVTSTMLVREDRER